MASCVAAPKISCLTTSPELTINLLRGQKQAHILPEELVKLFFNPKPIQMPLGIGEQPTNHGITTLLPLMLVVIFYPES